MNGQYLSRLTVVNMEFGRRTIGCFRYPHIQILSLTHFEKDAVVAIVQFGQLIDYEKVLFCVEFSVFFGVR